MKRDKKVFIQLLLFIGYTIILLPIFFCLLNSVPASDDFAFGSRTISDNLFIDAAGYSWWNWLYHSGRWLTFFFQKFINPLNSQTHLGRVYGIWMIAVFLLVFFLIKYSLKVIIGKLIGSDRININIVVFLVITVLFTTYYYSEAYNWYVGATAYAVPFGLLLLTLAYTIRFEETGNNNYYYGLILSGLIPATNEFLDVPLGLLYLYIVLYLFKLDFYNKKKVLKDFIPLIVFILGGITVVFAPGNFVRQDGYDVSPSMTAASKQIIIDVLVRVKDIGFHHPLAVVIFICLLLLGVKNGLPDDNKKNSIIVVLFLTFMCIFGTIFPYVYGRAMNSTYLDVRMQYLLDYELLIGICVMCLRMGMLASTRKVQQINKYAKICLAILAVAVVSVISFHGKAYQKIVPIDIVRNSELIKESYNFWDGVILEIENSPEDEVVITRDKELSWSPYFLYCGFPDGYEFEVEPDTVYSSESIMPNIYYGKKSLELRYSSGN